MAFIIYTSFRLSMAVFGISYIITFVFTMFLTKETANKPMAETYLSDTTDNDIGKSALETSFDNPNGIA